MAGAFVPPPGLLEGLGPYAYIPLDERQRMYNGLYMEWLQTPVEGAFRETEGLVPGVAAPATEPFQGVPLSDADKALLNTYEPNWRATPAYAQTPTQLAALIASAKRKEAYQVRFSGNAKPATYGGGSIGPVGPTIEERQREHPAMLPIAQVGFTLDADGLATTTWGGWENGTYVTFTTQYQYQPGGVPRTETTPIANPERYGGAKAAGAAPLAGMPAIPTPGAYEVASPPQRSPAVSAVVREITDELASQPPDETAQMVVPEWQGYQPIKLRPRSK